MELNLNSFAKSPARASRASGKDMPRTVAFLGAIRESKARISYAAFAVAAGLLGEDDTRQLAGQRGSFLVKSLPVSLQPYVCRSNGTYAKGVAWEVETPKDLGVRPVIGEETVQEAVAAWESSVEGKDEETGEAL